MALPYTLHSVLAALQNLSQQTNRVQREAILKAGLKEILKWFTLAAKNIIENKIKLPKQTTTFMTKHREEIERLAEEMKRKIILKPGGGGFLGGVIIRSLLRWAGSKTARKFGDDRQTRKRALRKKKTPKEKSSKKKSLRKSAPKKKSQRKSASKKKTPKKRTSTKRVSNKKSPQKRTPPQRTPSTSTPISSPNTSNMDEVPFQSILAFQSPGKSCYETDYTI